MSSKINMLCYLSGTTNYPNRSDRILGHKRKPGGDIFIHGNCASIGCIAITDDKIMELYLVAVEARAQGQDRIPVHIFPFRFNKLALEELPDRWFSKHRSFWKNLEQGYLIFQNTRKPPKVSVDDNGEYLFAE